ncbi:hypothetical protein OAO42_00550 [Candidatus Izimaplasma bacterium]|nr:hypothetical protein [Candidatus Izimaplasma bacterium]
MKKYGINVKNYLIWLFMIIWQGGALVMITFNLDDMYNRQIDMFYIPFVQVMFLFMIAMCVIFNTVLIYIVLTKLIKPVIVRDLITIDKEELVIRIPLLRNWRIPTNEILTVYISKVVFFHYLVIALKEKTEIKPMNIIMRKMFGLPKKSAILVSHLSIVNADKEKLCQSISEYMK